MADANAPLSPGMRNSLRALLQLQKSAGEQDRHFHAMDIYAQRQLSPYSWTNPLWERKESPLDALDTQNFLEMARGEGYVDRSITRMPGTSKDCNSYRIKQDKRAEIEKLVGGSDK